MTARNRGYSPSTDGAARQSARADSRPSTSGRAVRLTGDGITGGNVADGGEAIATLPLRDRDGNVIAYAIVDHDVYPELSQWRWSLGDRGYVVRSVRVGDGTQQKVRLHRVVMRCATGDGLEIDHINQNKFDNRRANLRYVTHAENLANLRTHCKRGHEFAEENTYRARGSTRECVACRKARRAKHAGVAV